MESFVTLNGTPLKSLVKYFTFDALYHVIFSAG
jgi:hypothetical protein